MAQLKLRSNKRYKSKNRSSSYNEVLCSRDLTINMRVCILRCYVFSNLLYRTKAQTLKQAEIKKLDRQKLEHWCYLTILRISLVDLVTNLEVLRRRDKDEEVLRMIKRHTLQHISHVMKEARYKLLRLIMKE